MYRLSGTSLSYYVRSGGKTAFEERYACVMLHHPQISAKSGRRGQLRPIILHAQHGDIVKLFRTGREIIHRVMHMADYRSRLFWSRRNSRIPMVTYPCSSRLGFILFSTRMIFLNESRVWLNDLISWVRLIISKKSLLPSCPSVPYIQVQAPNKVLHQTENKPTGQKERKRQ